MNFFVCPSLMDKEVSQFPLKNTELIELVLYGVDTNHNDDV